ncbi:ATP-binding protein [Leptolyngbya sp. FACHB-261]|uniref:ATP-binding protein n=1 Tax=Leptolyngbya sp. FACHB-261 TaxID=2692806 RepID=UPI0016882940|nr:ATP-binding protein [Leptolyngbya sp. FACHB-261]MBD2103042.1 PAS domain-containing protein [Leptolyngbya sp. FACHB-261]
MPSPPDDLVTGNGAPNDATAAAVLAKGGGMAERISCFDWSKTTLGPMATWPQSLKSLVKTLLASRYPMVLTWGPELIQFYNDAYSQLIGDKHPAALGLDIRITLAEAWDTLGPMIEEVMATGVANWLPALMLVMERSGYREESYFSVSHAPAEDDSGQIVGMLAVCSEVTQQILGERRLRLLRDLAAKAGETRSVEATCLDIVAAIAAHPLDVPFALLYLHEPDGKTLRLHGAVGLPVGEAASPQLVDLRSGQNQIRPLERACAGETVLVEAVDEHLAVAGGPWQELVHSALVMPIASSRQAEPLGVLIAGVSPNRALDEGYRSFYELLVGQVSVLVRNAQAYEEERQRAEALAELDRAKTTFFSNVSHEFRTPLTLMLGPAEDALADSEAPLPPQQRQRVEVLHRNSLRLLKLVNTLLDFSRIEADRVQAVYEPTDLATLTADLASVFRSAIERAGLRLVVNCPALPEPVHVDREMWEKIVLNLLSNAFKFTLEGEITVGLHWAGEAVELAVRDTGTGIPQQELPHLFDRFHRVQGAQGRTYEGSGIGLSLVQELVHLHGGTVEVISVLGEGSTFTVSIPTGTAHLPSERINAARSLASTALGASPFVEEALRWLPDEAETQAWQPDSIGTPEPPTSNRHPASRNLQQSRILLADDNADMRDYVRRLLSEQYAVTTVADGAAALAAIRHQMPDLVLSDVMMPGLDGFELVRQLRADSQTREVPIILLSARAGETEAVEGLAVGADDYLIKPFSARELLARVGATLEMGQLRREAARRRIDNILESISDAFIALDHEWRYIYVNQEAERLLRKPREELLGQSVWQAFPAIIGSAFETSLRQAVAEQVTLEIEEFYAPFAAWFEVHLYPSQEGLSIYFHETTERKQAQEELRLATEAMQANLAQLQAVVESMTEGLVIADPQGNILTFNPTALALHEYDSVEQVRRHLREFPDTFEVRNLSGELVPIAEWPLARALGGETFCNYEVQVRRIDTGRVWIGSYGGTPVRNQAGEVILATVTLRDVTEQKRLESERAQLLAREQAAREQAETANRLKDEFLTTLSHEIRTPLNGILGWAQMLRQGKLNAATTARALETIERNAKVQTQLIDDLLDVSRIIRGQLRLELQPVALPLVIELALETVQPTAQAKAIELQAVLDEGNLGQRQVLGDANRLQQVVWNLLTNAIKFTPSGGMVLVQLEYSATWVQLQVSDTGKGIKPEFLPYVFERFRQADGSITRSHGGLGLGLAIVRHIVELHGGSVWAHSLGEGQGATFTVQLPLKD